MRQDGVPSQLAAAADAYVRPSSAAAKAQHRREMVAGVRALSGEQRALAGEAAATTLSAFLDARLAPGAIVGIYAATSTELDSAPAVRVLGARYALAFPRVSGDSIRFHRASFESLTAHSSRIREPLPSDPEVLPAAMVIPARAYDRFGVRLGHGAGYYDRTLAALPGSPLLVGYCYSFQVVDELPRELYDRWVHWLVTDQGDPRCCQALPARAYVFPGGSSSPESPGASVPAERDVS